MRYSILRFWPFAPCGFSRRCPASSCSRSWLAPWLAAILLCSPVCPAASGKLTRDDFKKLFHGKVTSADEDGNVGLLYDFSSASQLEDFEGAPASGIGRLQPESGGVPAWFKAQFEGNINLDLRITTGGRECYIYLLVDPEIDEGYVFIFGVEGYGGTTSLTGVGKYRKGREPEIIYRGRLGVFKAGKYTISVSRRGDELQLKLDKRVIMKTRDKSYRSGKIGFGGELSIAELNVRGKLNLRWCEKALAALDEKAAPEEQELEDFFWQIGIQPGLRLEKALPDWAESYRKETPHYLVESDVSQKFTDQYAQGAETMYSMYAAIFPAPTEQADKLRILLFKTREGFIRFGAPKNVLGFYHPETRNVYLYDHVRPAVTQKVLLHEGFHQYLNLLIEEPPIWFNEGMATYFETATMKENQFKVGTPGVRLGHLGRLAQDGMLCKLPAFMSIDLGQFQDPNAAAKNYSYAWGLAHFLLHYKNGVYRKHLVNYFRLLQRGAKNPEAMVSAFGNLDWVKVKGEWSEYILGLYEKKQPLRGKRIDEVDR